MRKVLGLLLIFVLVLTACSKKENIDVASLIGTDKLPYEYYYASFAIDEKDLVQLTSFVDYVFVGTVTEYDKTEYDEEDVRTYYKVSVEENIKGELTMSEDILLVKAGGIVEDGSKFVVCENDILPKVGEKYVFCAYVMEYIDELYCFGPNTVCKIEDSEQWKNDDVYIKYVEASETIAEGIFEGKHIVSRYDVNYSK